MKQKYKGFYQFWGLFSSNKAYCKHKGRVPRFQTLFLYPHFPSLPRVSSYCLPISPTKWKHCLATSILFWLWSSEEHIVKTMLNFTARQKCNTLEKTSFLPNNPNSVEFSFKNLWKISTVLFLRMQIFTFAWDNLIFSWIHIRYVTPTYVHHFIFLINFLEILRAIIFGKVRQRGD